MSDAFTDSWNRDPCSGPAPRDKKKYREAQGRVFRLAAELQYQVSMGLVIEAQKTLNEINHNLEEMERSI